MDFKQYSYLVAQIKIGKRLPDAIYLHNSLLKKTYPNLFKIFQELGKTLEIKPKQWNVIKFARRDFKFTLLNYPDFDLYAYPALHHSYTVDLEKMKVRKANYSSSENPPILHRKETFVDEKYPKYSDFQKITHEGEAIGLYENTKRIGFKKNWAKLIRSKGFELDDAGNLRPLAKKDKKAPFEVSGDVERHKTAIDRNQLSAPMKILANHDYFNGDYSILDYGCGKGDDLRELEAHGIDAEGWDPVYRAETKLRETDIVNLGFVINVIEDRQERVETLIKAYNLSEKMIIVAVMVAGESVISQFVPYKDGVLTSRNTFQKYYSQNEAKSFVEDTLERKSVAVGQGIFIVFKDELEEQHFLLERQHIKRDWKQLIQRELKSTASIPKIKKDLIEKYQELFRHFWDLTLDLGRIPANSEFEFSERLRAVAGSHRKAFDALIQQNGDKVFEAAQQARRQDLMVYFALGLFAQRKSYKDMPESLKRDIKMFFGKYTDALVESKDLLFSVGKPDVIETVSIQAYERFNIGEFNEGHSWILPIQLLNDLPPELKIYVKCASQLYGDLDGIHLIKIHFTSGKVTLLQYDDWSKEEPLLTERIKIKLREQDIDFFIYGERYKSQPLLNKKVYYK